MSQFPYRLGEEHGARGTGLLSCAFFFYRYRGAIIFPSFWNSKLVKWHCCYGWAIPCGPSPYRGIGARSLREYSGAQDMPQWRTQGVILSVTVAVPYTLEKKKKLTHMSRPHFTTSHSFSRGKGKAESQISRLFEPCAMIAISTGICAIGTDSVTRWSINGFSDLRKKKNSNRSFFFD